MRLTLIHPAIGKRPNQKYIRGWQMEPLPAAHLAGLTPKDIKITFFDDRMETIDYERPTDLVAISVETYTAKRSYQIASEYRKRNIPVVMGGFHATLMTKEVLQYAESVVVGEAENSWPELIEDFRRGQLKRLYKAEKRPSIESISPERSIFKNKSYLKIGLIEAGRGCVFKCDFCVIQKFFSSTQNRRGIETIIKEIKSIQGQHKMIFFVDDNAVSHPEESKKFFRALIPLKIKWVSQATVTMTYDDELLALMKESGCQGILIGFETLNPKNLKEMNKSFNTAKGSYDTVLHKLHKFGIRLYATFIFGYDADTIDSFKKTIDFCMRHKIFMVAFNHLTPFPGTPLYDRLEKEGRLLYDKWWLHPDYRYGEVPFKTKLDPITIENECLKARASFYSIPSIFKRFFHPTNCGDVRLLGTYLFINFLLRLETKKRHKFPLGDIHFKGPLLKVNDIIKSDFSSVKRKQVEFIEGIKP